MYRTAFLILRVAYLYENHENFGDEDFIEKHLMEIYNQAVDDYESQVNNGIISEINSYYVSYDDIEQ